MVEPIWVEFKLIGAEEIKKKLEGVTNRMEDMQKSSRELRTGFLSLMFAGMAVSKLLGGLWKDLRRFGIETSFSLIKLSLLTAVMTSPVFNAFRNITFKISKTFMNLPDSVKEVIGVFQIFGGWLGGAVATGGSLALFILGLEALGVNLTGLALAGGPIALVVAGIAGLYILFREGGPVVKQWGEDTWAALVMWEATKWHPFWENVKTTVSNVWGGIKNVVTSTWESIWNWISSNMPDWMKKLLGIEVTYSQPPANTGPQASSGGGSTQTEAERYLEHLRNRENQIAAGLITPRGFQLGGRVLSTGLAVVHKGEEVIPASKAGGGSVTYSPTINIQASISSDMDIDDLARRINERMNIDFTSRLI